MKFGITKLTIFCLIVIDNTVGGGFVLIFRYSFILFNEWTY